MKTEQEIKELLYEKLSYIYCDNCRGDESACDECIRKQMGWQASDSFCESIAKEIIA